MMTHPHRLPLRLAPTILILLLEGGGDTGKSGKEGMRGRGGRGRGRERRGRIGGVKRREAEEN